MTSVAMWLVEMVSFRGWFSFTHTTLLTTSTQFQKGARKEYQVDVRVNY